MGMECGIYDEYLIRTMMIEYAQKHGKPYADVMKEFIETVALPALKRFENIAPNQIESIKKMMFMSAQSFGIPIATNDTPQ